MLHPPVWPSSPSISIDLTVLLPFRLLGIPPAIVQPSNKTPPPPLLAHSGPRRPAHVFVARNFLSTSPTPTGLIPSSLPKPPQIYSTYTKLYTNIPFSPCYLTSGSVTSQSTPAINIRLSGKISMARTAEATLLQQYATARETRASAIIAQRSDMQVLMDNAQNNGKPSNTKSGPISQKVPTLDSTSSDNDGNDENNDEDGETADDEEEEDEPEDFAPSELTKRKRGHQTGLSVSLSNTSIGKRSYDRKRARSLSDGSDDETRRPNKLPKSNHRPEPEIELESVSDDDSDYSGVDLISESEQEDTDIEREEEQQIIYDESSEGDMVIDQNQGAVSVESWEGFAGNDEIITHDPSLFSAQITGPNDADEMLSMTGALPDTPTQSRPARRVRFADDVEMDDQSSSSSSSSDSEVDHNIFPDIFVDQAQLAPEFRQMIEHGNEDTGSLPDSDNSWWDYEGVNTGQVMESALMEPVMNQLYPATTTAEDPNECEKCDL